MEKGFAKDIHIFKLFWVFLLTAFLGSLIQIVLNSVLKRQFVVCSGVVYGWFHIFLGVGAVIATMLFHKMKQSRDFILIILGTLVCGVYQYIYYLVQEHFFGMRFDTVNVLSKFNALNGRVNLLFCLIGGILIMFWIKDIYPVVSNFIEKIPPIIGNSVSVILMLLMAVNLIISAMALIRMRDRHIDPIQYSPMDIFLDLQYPDDFLTSRMPGIRMVEVPEWREELPIDWEKEEAVPETPQSPEVPQIPAPTVLQ